jgi:hypothetical protein
MACTVTIRTGDLPPVDIALANDEGVAVSHRTTRAGCFLVQLAALDVVALHIDCVVPAHESGGRAPVTGVMTMFKGAKGIHRKMADQKTVYDVTYDLLRSLGLTTVFGNPR